MSLLEFLKPEAVMPVLKSTSKKQALADISAHAAKLIGRDSSEIYEVLLQRERLGSTGIGEGIAIPHGKLPHLDKLFGLVARLEKPVDFEAMDGMPVDIVFLLLAPEGAGADHLKALSQVARLLRDQEILEQIRSARDGAEIYAVMTALPLA
ncbi:PTS IIA-like nitrogen regulatory protein PtsN [Microvirga sp. W0021]|uniref:PTS IIA-like nitrogen regulatory protein PtsN n=1 Tax=Hohaiivirga grylli TaxID=3133970 RepID=A0ABV0BHA3_9HYPH